MTAPTLAEWLLERYAAEEKMARAAMHDAPSPGMWHATDRPDGAVVLARFSEDSGAGGGVLVAEHRASCRDTGLPLMEHVAEWSPRRVVRECRAKRAIVALHEPHWDGREWFCYHCDHARGYGFAETCPTLLALAQPYRGEPGWQDEWTVET